MSNILTVSQLTEKILAIIDRQEKINTGVAGAFIGVPKAQMINLLEMGIDDNALINRDPGVHFSDEDVNAVSNSRFMRGAGFKLLMAWVVVLFITYFLCSTILNALWLFYILNGVYAIVFVVIYTKELKKYRKELWAQIRPGRK